MARSATAIYNIIMISTVLKDNFSYFVYCALFRPSLFVGVNKYGVYAMPSLVEEGSIMSEVRL